MMSKDTDNMSDWHRNVQHEQYSPGNTTVNSGTNVDIVCVLWMVRLDPPYYVLVK
jgi:hypothetical protein